MSRYELAQIVEALDEVNALADASPGFVWRLQTEDGNATALRPYEDESILINMSVWRDVDALAEYVYRSDHTAFLRRRREWFERLGEVYLALWWVPAGHRPTEREGVDRLAHLRHHGPTPHAFNFRTVFAPEGGDAMRGAEGDRCPA
jgi:hypothetical protein